MKYYRQLIDLETQLIKINTINKVLAAIAAGIPTIPAEDDKADIIYFMSEALENESSSAKSIFDDLFRTIREDSHKEDSLKNKASMQDTN